VAKVVCWPVDGWSKTGEHEVPPVTPTIECAGGEAAVIDIPYPIARRFQGMEMIFDIVCSAQFPFGKGVQLSEADGTPVGEPRDEWEDLARTAVATLFKLDFIFGHSTPANVRVILPTDVAEVIPPDMQPKVTILHTYTPPVEQRSREPMSRSRGEAPNSRNETSGGERWGSRKSG
jgi:hypothetical protein